ncbi:phospholipase D family protein [Microbacterium sp. NPDC008134]|uniref:phospholipase D family protein n=1 Tax=Microbacterium sp. NPDC008134 TaxID=3364183 RepID=UPI0036E52DDF
MRRTVDRVDVFAHAGFIGLGAASDLVTVLEPMIHPVLMPHGLFHPKVWFLEFAAGDERRYRFICSSRNLTNDRTWDAVVTLDGAPASAREAATERANAGMVRLLRWLATDRRTAPRMTEARRARVDHLADAWETVEWERPDDAKRMNVHILGVGQDPQISHDAIKTLIVSPFVTDDGVRRLRARADHETILVSRPEQLDRLQPSSFPDLTMQVLDDYVDQALADAEVQDTVASSLSGLHAKLLVHDRAGGGSTMVIGSANATIPAWTRNVEAMVELDGPTKRLGVDVIAQSLAPLLENYETDGGQTASEDEEAERRLDDVLRRLASSRLSLQIHIDDPFALSLWVDDDTPAPPADVHLSWRLLTQSEAFDGSFPPADAPRRWGPLPLDQITPFIVLTVKDDEGRRAQTLVIAEIINDVPGRGDAIVAGHLTEPGALARFIRLMLQSAGGVASSSSTTFAAFATGFGSGISEDGSGLLELLVRASASSPHVLTDIEGVLAHLSDEEQAHALPDGFSHLWASVVDAVDANRSQPSGR